MTASTSSVLALAPATNAEIEAVTPFYHAWVNGLMLAIASRAGPERGARVVFAAFRRQQREKFLAGLEKLGLTGLPHAVACAQYHYLSNALGGAKVEWIPESDRKSWVRYAPPRWIFDGATICGIPTEMSRAMMYGWHANNGVLLGNPKLGFACTSQTTDGGPGAIGYYFEADRDLAVEERLQFRPGEAPPDTVADLPRVDWPEDRLIKLRRNYTVEYIRSLTEAMFAVLGPADAAAIGRLAARQIGMQFHDSLCRSLGLDTQTDTPTSTLANLLARFLVASGEAVTLQKGPGNECLIEMKGWRFARGLDLPVEGFEAWNGALEGISAVHGERKAARLMPVRRADLGDECFAWSIRM
jgi:hypothetical protein